jgi:hypothetical protein
MSPAFPEASKSFPFFFLMLVSLPKKAEKEE